MQKTCLQGQDGSENTLLGFLWYSVFVLIHFLNTNLFLDAVSCTCFIRQVPSDLPAHLQSQSISRMEPPQRGLAPDQDKAFQSGPPFVGKVFH